MRNFDFIHKQLTDASHEMVLLSEVFRATVIQRIFSKTVNYQACSCYFFAMGIALMTLRAADVAGCVIVTENMAANAWATDSAICILAWEWDSAKLAIETFDDDRTAHHHHHHDKSSSYHANKTQIPM